MIRKIILIIILLAGGIGIYYFYFKDKPAHEIYGDITYNAKKVKSEVRSAVTTQNIKKDGKSPTDWQNLLPANEKQIYEAAKAPPKDK